MDRTRRGTLFLVWISAVYGCSAQAANTPPVSNLVTPNETLAADTVEPESAVSAEAHQGPPHFAYSGDEGPDKWGELWPEWKACQEGRAQSPIDLPQTDEQAKGEAKFTMAYSVVPLSILNNGHTVQVPVDGGQKLTLEGVDYELVQFHLHAPSEHTVAGKPLDGELHLVHENAHGEIAVVGVLLQKGMENETLAAVFAAAPSDTSGEAKPVANASVDLAAIVPSHATFYSYSGSLTTPPCSEGVRWQVLTQPIEVSEAQLDHFKEAMHGDDARPVQPLAGRHVSLVQR